MKGNIQEIYASLRPQATAFSLVLSIESFPLF